MAWKYRFTLRPQKRDAAQFALGVIAGIGMAFEALDNEYWEEQVIQKLRETDAPDEIDRLVHQGERWMRRRMF